jgi:hypothetical protein
LGDGLLLDCCGMRAGFEQYSAPSSLTGRR